MESFRTLCSLDNLDKNTKIYFYSHAIVHVSRATFDSRKMQKKYLFHLLIEKCEETKEGSRKYKTWGLFFWFGWWKAFNGKLCKHPMYVLKTEIFHQNWWNVSWENRVFYVSVCSVCRGTSVDIAIWYSCGKWLGPGGQLTKVQQLKT